MLFLNPNLTAKDTVNHPTQLCTRSFSVRAPKTRVYAVDLMFGRYRVLVTVSAAFPISNTDGEVVYNFRGTLDTANFLGQLFRTFSEVLNLGPRQEQAVPSGTGKSNPNSFRGLFLSHVVKKT